jgi:prophage antirepressor-like protein
MTKIATSYKGCVIDIKSLVENPVSEKDVVISGALIPALEIDGGIVETQVDESGVTWFKASDITSNLGYKNSAKALGDNVKSSDITVRYTRSSGQGRNVNFINESGLYSLILGSKLPKAKEFKHWITSEVLPSIRKTGSYSIDNTEGAGFLTKLKEVSEVAKYVSDILHAVLPKPENRNEQLRLSSTVSRVTRKFTGFDIQKSMELKLVTEGEQKPTKSIMAWLNTKSTKVAAEANKKLLGLGLIEGTPGNYKLTEKGTQAGGVTVMVAGKGSGTSSGKDVVSIEWTEEILDYLK